MSETNPNVNILKKLSLVMREATYIQKDARNQHGNYKYASEKAIKETLHPILAKHGVVFQVNTQLPVVMQETKTQYLPVEYIFWDSDSGECISGNFVGSAHTRDEKGHYAAITGVIKYILTTTFLIPTGDDPENDNDKTAKGRTAQKPTATAKGDTTANAGEAKPQTPASGNPDFFEELQWLQTYEDMLIKCGMTHEKVAAICKAATGKSVDQMEKATPIQRRNYKEALLKALEANGVTVEAANG